MKDKVLNIFNRPEVQAGLSTATEGISISNPAAGLILTAVKDVVSVADEVRAQRILKGLASGLNQETHMNELQNFIAASDQNALFIADVLRKALLSDSLIVCTLMGRIVADHASRNTPFDQYDAIIVHAVESATDDDLREFYHIMNSLSDDGFVETENKLVSDWGANCRLFRNNDQITWGEVHDGPKRVPTEVATRLMEYLDEVRFCLVEGL